MNQVGVIMSGVSKLLDDQVVQFAKSALKTIGKNALLARKLNAVIAASKHGITTVAKVYDISRTTLTEWVKHVKAEQLIKLQAPIERKRKSILNDADRAIVKSWIEADPNLTLDSLALMVADGLNKTISRTTMYREIVKMKYSYITPRKQHINKDPKLAEEFKKKST